MRNSSRMVTLEIQLELLMQVLCKRDFFELQRKKENIYENIICSLLSISIKDLKSKSVKKNIVFGRQLCMWYLRNTTSMSLNEIGGEYGNKTHGTVIHSCRVIENIIETKNKEYYPIICEFRILSNYKKLDL